MSQTQSHPYSFDIRLSPPILASLPLPSPADTPPYTPRSKSLDLLRSNSTPISTTRNSLDTVSTLKGGQRISSPIFLNSSVGVKPLQEISQHCTSFGLEFDIGESDTLSFSPHVSATRDLGGDVTKIRDSTMSRLHQTSDVGLRPQPKTPSRRQISDHLLRSKFSMSPVQVSKRSKARNSQDRPSLRLSEGIVSQDNAKSTIGNWSHSLGVAARKLQLPRKGSDESYKSQLMLEVPQEEAAPEKGKNSLRSAPSFASLRRFITPSRRIRRVSATTRDLANTKRIMMTVDDVLVESFPSVDQMSWAVDEPCQSRDDVAQTQADNEGCDAVTASYQTGHGMTPCPKRKAREIAESERAAFRGRSALMRGFYEPPSPERGEAKRRAILAAQVNTTATTWMPSKDTSQERQEQNSHGGYRPSEQRISPAPEQATVPTQGKLKTLQLLARRPFSAFGKKVRETQKSWFPTRTPCKPRLSSTHGHQRAATTEEMVTRRSEDLLSKASPRICDSTMMAQKSKSVELDRISLPSKVVPLRPTAGVAYKRRPTIPDAFAKPPNPPPKARGEIGPSCKQIQIQPRISDLRHPWMKQLQLSSTANAHQVDHFTKGSIPCQIWPSVPANASPPSSAGNIPTFSLTAASLTLAETAMPTSNSAPTPANDSGLNLTCKKQSPRRPPASLLGQSLPIPPRSVRSRASTISSQSSCTSSPPSGKVIVSRRSYGTHLRSPVGTDDSELDETEWIDQDDFAV
uniref:Uncharacterized protein n=1 Tax=Melanopsichium pennsylvanicum 4 TaxID=1398559 RepID=A0A077QV22_9BASI|nr:putative protein [Melanopsichium pennsylvanicum 4]